jgi:hypothetical protein
MVNIKKILMHQTMVFIYKANVLSEKHPKLLIKLSISASIGFVHNKQNFNA